MAKISGVAAHQRRLQRIRGPRMVEAVTRELLEGARDVQVEAQLSISTGATSGKNHVPSTAPDPPNNDSGGLAGNIEAVVTGPLKAETSSNAPYAVAQEVGSEKLNLPARPYMAPAATKARPKVRKRIVRAVEKVTRGAR